MAEGAKWTPGKIVLLIVGILAGLALLCCGIGAVVFGDKIKAGIAFKNDAVAYVERLHKDYGPTAVFSIEKNDRNEMILAIGAEGELTAARVVEIEDGAWKALGECFGADGFLPVKHVAIGNPQHGTGVVGWSRNMVSVDELVKRTGVPAPPNAKFLPENFQGQGVRIDVKGGSGDSENGTKQEGGGGGGK